MQERGHHSPPIAVAHRYTDFRKLPEGGMAQVYSATDTRLGRKVAIKFIRPDKGQNPQFQARFRREIRALTQLQHPGIVKVYDVHTGEDGSYFAMEFIQGASLRSRIVSGEISEELILNFLDTVIPALKHAHDRGIYHRDLKPENLLISEEGYFYIADFGIAFVTEEDATMLTMADQTLGTPYYTAPEQIQNAGARYAAASDQYSLGVILYELLGGYKPFSGDWKAIFSGHLHRQPPPLILEDYARNLAYLRPLVARMLEKDPAVRFANMESLQNAYRKLRNGEAVHDLQDTLSIPLMVNHRSGQEPPPGPASVPEMSTRILDGK